MKNLLSIFIFFSFISIANAQEPPKQFLCTTPSHTDTMFFSINGNKVTLETDGNLISGGLFEKTEEYYFFHFIHEGTKAKFRLNRYTRGLSLYLNDKLDNEWPDTAKCELVEKSF